MEFFSALDDIAAVVFEVAMYAIGIPFALLALLAWGGVGKFVLWGISSNRGLARQERARQRRRDVQ